MRARRLLTERDVRHEALRQAIAAVSGQKLALSLRQVTDALVRALPIDVATLRLLDADANLHSLLPAASAPPRPDGSRSSRSQHNDSRG